MTTTIAPSLDARPATDAGAGFVLRGAALLFAGQALGQAASFVRNLVVARMISAADFGIASTFAISIGLLDMLGDLAVDKLLVQAKDGDDARMQSAAQFVQALRGLVAGAALFLLAGPIAAAFGVPDARWAFQALGLVPAINGFAHLDVRRFQREMRYLPCTAVDAAPQIVATLAAWPLALWLGDYRVALACALLQAATTTALSHAFADRRYSWSRDRGVVARIFRFGWPLVVNAILMCAIFQGDRVVVASSYSLAELGAYSLAFSIAFVPTQILARVATAVSLPLLSRDQDDPERFRRRAAVCAQTIAFATALVIVPLVGAGGPLITGLFGDKYVAAVAVLPWLAAMQGVRMLRVAPVLTAMARADTVNSMLSNVWRTTALGAMAVAAAKHMELRWIAAAGLGGEIVAFLYSTGRLRRLHGIPSSAVLAPCAIAFAGAAAAIACAETAPLGRGAAAEALASAAVLAATLGAMLAAYPGLRASLGRAVRAASPRFAAAVPQGPATP